MEIPIAIHGYAIQDQGLFEQPVVRKGAEKQLTEGLLVRFDGGEVNEDPIVPFVAHITLVIAEKLIEKLGEDAVTLLITDWLLKKLRKKEMKSLLIDRITVDLEQGQIKRIVLEKVHEMRK